MLCSAESWIEKQNNEKQENENLFLQFYKVVSVFIFNSGCINVSNGSQLLLSNNLKERKIEYEQWFDRRLKKIKILK